MTSRSGSGVYELLELLGRGGMGEVYRARDARLGRDVAIKVLPANVAADPDRVARLEREARLLAALNHPAIATIHGLDTVDGQPALVLELVEGPTLAERLVEGGAASTGARLPQAEALAIAKQIAEALEAAHDKGIVHRDLKPANIKFTRDGRVKVLDFGLAKIAEPSGRDEGATAFPTVMATGGHSLIAGTPAYMSPEQARGDILDRRTDTWAFGCVLFEMLTGAKAFPGETLSDIISSILRVEPAWDALPGATPLALRLLLKRCLAKDAQRRLQHVGDARVEIDQLLTDPAAADVRPHTSGTTARANLPWALAAVLVTALGAISVPALRQTRASAPAAPTVEFSIPTRGAGPTIRISPDGKYIAYNAPAPTGAPAIWVCALDSLTPRMLPGTEGNGPFGWSWDSRSIVFVWNPTDATSGRKLKRIGVPDGTAQSIADEPTPGAIPAWGRQDVIVFGGASTLKKVSASGADVTEVTTLDESLHERYHMWPNFLPDGRHFTYLAWTVGSADDTHATLYLGSIDPAEARIRLTESDSEALYAPPGYLLFGKGHALVARPFDAERLRFTGDPVTIVDNVAMTNTGRLGVGVSEDGTLVYRSPVAAPGTSFNWFDRSGGPPATSCKIAVGGAVNKARLSRDGRHVAAFSEGDVDIWLCDLERQLPTRLTNDAYFDREPVWSPDGAAVAFQSFRSPGNRESAIYQKAANGLTPETLLLAAEPNTNLVPLDWSADNKWLVYSKQAGAPAADSPDTNRDIWVLPLSGDRIPRKYADSPFDETQAAISPDSRFLAYASNEVGRTHEVIVGTFPDPSKGIWKISANGGCCPRWKQDGTELFYMDGNRHLVAVPIATTPTFAMGRSITLDIVINAGATLARGAAGSYGYDVSPDGRRFLIPQRESRRVQDEDSGLPINVILNWTSLLRR
jgi:serine/threonine protein kinase/Tol biopolymer transport system component